MIGSRPAFLNSPFFYSDVDGWHLKAGAPTEVQKEFNDCMEALKEQESAPGSKA